MSSDQALTATFIAVKPMYARNKPAVINYDKPFAIASGSTFRVHTGLQGVEAMTVEGEVAKYSPTTFTITATTLAPKRVAIGRAADIVTHQHEHLYFKLNPTGAKLLRKLKSLTVTLRIVASAPGFPSSTTVKKITIHRPH